MSFYDFPQEHLVHLHTSNAIESIFAGVRNCTKVAKHMQKQETAHFLVWKVIMWLSLNWWGINAPNQLQLLLAGHAFTNGKLNIPNPPPQKEEFPA